MGKTKEIYLIVVGAILALFLEKYILPILPDGSIVWQYSLIGLKYILTYGTAITVIIINMKYKDFDKVFVLNMLIGFGGLILYIVMDMFDYVLDQLISIN